MTTKKKPVRSPRSKSEGDNSAKARAADGVLRTNDIVAEQAHATGTPIIAQRSLSTVVTMALSPRPGRQ